MAVNRCGRVYLFLTKSLNVTHLCSVVLPSSSVFSFLSDVDHFIRVLRSFVVHGAHGSIPDQLAAIIVAGHGLGQLHDMLVCRSFAVRNVLGSIPDRFVVIMTAGQKFGTLHDRPLVALV